jgi:hypothetical protein
VHGAHQAVQAVRAEVRDLASPTSPPAAQPTSPTHLLTTPPAGELPSSQLGVLHRAEARWRAQGLVLHNTRGWERSTPVEAQAVPATPADADVEAPQPVPAGP